MPVKRHLFSHWLLFRTSWWRSSYLLQHCRRGWSELSSAFPPCSSQSRCGSTETRASRGWERSPSGRELHRWLASAGWHRGTAASPHNPLRRKSRFALGVNLFPLNEWMIWWVGWIRELWQRWILLIHVCESHSGQAWFWKLVLTLKGQICKVFK